MWHPPLDITGRKHESIVLAFALSLLMHGSMLFVFARDAAKDSTLSLGFSPQPASLAVRLIAAPAQPAPAAIARSEPAPAAQTPPSPPASHLEDAAQFASSPSSTAPKFIDLKTGNQLDLSYWRGAKRQGRPLRIRLTINPAGLIASWELLTPGAESLQLDLAAMNNMVRNMDAAKTGETHVLIWESQVGKKNGELIAKIQMAGDN